MQPIELGSAATSGASLPLWMQITALVLAVVLTLFKLWEYLKQPTLEVRLTNEIFFRVMQGGESLFANAVLLCRDGPVEIRDAIFNLQKTDPPQKNYHLRMAHMGTKVIGPNNLAEFQFYATSPAAFMSANTHERLVFVLIHNEYGQKIKGVFQDFERFNQQYREKIVEDYRKGELREDARGQLITDVTNNSQKTSLNVMSNIQLEQGSYKLRISIKYKPSGFLIRNLEKEATSSIKFKIEPTARDDVKASLDTALINISMNAIIDQKDDIPLVQYNPTFIEEN